jgi:sortase (surface protein transpeptidase)
VDASPLVSLGLTAANEHEVPPVEEPEVAGWYEPGPEPGQVGPSIILGHVNGGGRPGVFAKLDQLKPGDEITVDQNVFRVTEVQRADKDAFPADRVYAETTQPELRLITCGGAFDSASGNYLDNVIVYAVLMGG